MKYGLPASESDRIVERHFADMEQQQCIDAAVFALELQGATSVPAHAVQPQPATVSVAAPPPVAMPVAAATPSQPVAPDLRAQLGLS
jgi:hypothetical protein